VAWADGPETTELLRRLADDGDDADALDALVRAYTPMAEFLARRFRGRNLDISDLEQTAKVGLVAALRRYDPDRGVRFSTFATATIVGELKRSLRDRAWPMRVPRRLQEEALAVHHTAERLTQELGRAPDDEEIAADTETDVETIRAARAAGRSFVIASLDAPVHRAPDAPSIADAIGRRDEVLRLVAHFATVEPVIRALPERQRHILYLRFFEGLTQGEIGERVGISQVHVSRLISRALGHIRRKTQPAIGS
jgi:RNA polymerase sigma-B factor